ncbi:MAG: hypothetical protein LJE70_16565 [Chromatiaceae bacterium]|nr:hypothetical protein [Chromatiaceae bacterium]
MLPLPILFEDDLDETIILDSDDNENMLQFRDAAAVTTNWPMNSDCDGDGVSDAVDWNGDGAMNQFRMPATLGDRGLSIDLNEDGEIDIAALEGCDVDPSSNEATTVNRPPISKPNGPYIEECQGAVAHVQLCSRLEIQDISAGSG